MDAPPPAITTVRGFHGTPVTSGDEDSDYGVGGSVAGSGGSVSARRNRKKRLPILDDVVSANCSPVLRPAGGSPAMSGIAKLRMQLEPLSLDTSAASSRANSPVPTSVASRPKPKPQPLALNQEATKAGHLHKCSSSSSASRVNTGSSRSNSHEVSSNTSADEADPTSRDRDITTSYVINLENDFVSDSVVRENVRWTIEDGLVCGDMDLDKTAAEPTDNSNSNNVAEAEEGEKKALGQDGTVEHAEDLSTSAPGTTTADDAIASTADASTNDPPRKKMTSDDFEPLRCLGKGSYGTVLLVKQNSTGRLYAQKQFKKASLVVHKKLVEQTKTERQILESVNRHPFVVKLYYAFQDREKLYLILEYGQGGELFTHLSTERMFSEPTAAFYMAEMVLALSHLHDTLGVVYRDLKPENCLLDAEGHLLLTDFGLSKVALPGEDDDDKDDSSCCHSILGTVEYMAPEVVQGQKYGRAVDWWSFGALGYDLLTGNPPFRGRNNAKIQDNIVRQKLVLPYFLSPDAKDLLSRLLRKEPRKRLGAHMPKDLATMKAHRFFRRIDWKKLAARQLEPPIQPVITDPELAENFAPEFTELALSPVLSPMAMASAGGGTGPGRRGSRTAARSPVAVRGRRGTDAAGSFKDDPFGGFSFVASTSVLNDSNFPML